MNPDVYRRPNKPLTIPVRRRGEFTPAVKVETPAVVMVDRATECHVTPPDIAARMVEYLGEPGDFLTLEPSAGTGNLVRALLESGHSRHEICLVERHNSLAAALQHLSPVINRCFLEYAAEVRGKVQFPRIIMNPPFSAVRRHVAAARSLLGADGHASACLVALVPVTFDPEGCEVLEQLPEDTFSTARIRTKIIRYRQEA